MTGTLPVFNLTEDSSDRKVGAAPHPRWDAGTPGCCFLGSGQSRSPDAVAPRLLPEPAHPGRDGDRRGAERHQEADAALQRAWGGVPHPSLPHGSPWPCFGMGSSGRAAAAVLGAVTVGAGGWHLGTQSKTIHSQWELPRGQNPKAGREEKALGFPAPVFPSQCCAKGGLELSLGGWREKQK